MSQITNKEIYDELTKLRIEMQGIYVTKDAFDPVKRIVYGLVAITMIAVIGALLSLVVIKTSRTNAIAISRLLK